jgi:hypothetical protein
MNAGFHGDRILNIDVEMFSFGFSSGLRDER